MLIRIYSYIYKSIKYINKMIFPKELYIYKYDKRNNIVMNYTWNYYLLLFMNYTGTYPILNYLLNYGEICDYLIVTCGSNNIRNYYLKKKKTLNQIINDREYNKINKSRRPLRIYINNEEDMDIVNKIKNIDNNTKIKDILKFSNHKNIDKLEIRYMNKNKSLAMNEINDLTINDIINIIKN
jgi:hypothetical protein